MKLNVANLGKVAITVEEQPWNRNKAYDRLTIVESGYMSYISRIPVPKGQPLVDNRKYWVPFSTRTAVKVYDFVVLAAIEQLPQREEDNNGPYLIDGTAYFWVGEGGDTLDHKYQSVRIQGEDGKSAYEIWLDHYDGDDKNEWTEERWINEWIIGDPGEAGPSGDSAYAVYVKECQRQGVEPLGISGWLESLKGVDGKSAYDVYVERCEANSVRPLDVDSWLASLRGKDGIPGAQGPQGPAGPQGETGPAGKDGKDGEDGAPGAQGPKGDTGQSAYEYAKAHASALGLPNNLTPAQWYESLKGARGEDGKSAYETALEVLQAQGYDTSEMTEASWIASLKGPKGDAGVASIITDVQTDNRTNMIRITVSTGGSVRNYYCQIPAIQIISPSEPGGGGGDVPGGTVVTLVNEVTKVLRGTLDAAKTYVEGDGETNNKGKFFQWILDETTEDGPILKVIWHIGGCVFIDALGYVIYCPTGTDPYDITTYDIPAEPVEEDDSSDSNDNNDNDNSSNE